MRILAFDTATAACSVVVRAAGATLARRSERLGRGHAERLLPMIEEAMAEAGLDYAALDGLAVTVGPGTFTGVRIGLATARGFALATGLPLVGVTTLEAMAAAHGGAAPVAAVLGAGRDRVYLQVFGADGGPVGPPEAVTMADAAALLPRGARVVGDVAERLAALVDDAVAVAALPDAETVAAIAVGRLAAGAPQGGPPVPLYVRSPDAKPMRRPAWSRP